jgi:ribosomal protein L35AE/L33A
MRLLLALALLFTASPLLAAKPRPCVTPDEAAKYLNKDICISVHVYDVVELSSGTRFLDTCAPDTPDDNCRFTIMSLQEDRDTVGELTRYRDTDVQIRGIVTPMHGRSGILLSHARQFNGGPPKFRPNPRLARGFTAEQDRPPVADPNLRGQGRGRAFMNRLDQEKLPPK